MVLFCCLKYSCQFINESLIRQDDKGVNVHGMSNYLFCEYLNDHNEYKYLQIPDPLRQLI